MTEEGEGEGEEEEQRGGDGLRNGENITLQNIGECRRQQKRRKRGRGGAARQ
jgi:hypothetical protein